MFEIFKILLATIFGTTAMTAFSYYVSEKFREIFKEPVLLNFLLKTMKKEWLPERTVITGWILHYLFGLCFVLIFHAIWSWTDIDPTWFTGVIFGMISGVVGIISWHFMFTLSSSTPKIKFEQYYIQLFIAHIIFALTVIAVYKFFKLF
ncbi:hypothetical protein GV828_03025 [Flavobacterium sp. NST-5]|uniref:DUF2938 domain-containing protein n=1 Tax=Flavobacterium ichthyis TaxID=2698827 RepID=A0ABW9ZAQ4_9FLAO|nr:hypothetical protein [Flavobacterium ichthyis]NBL64170.1 hypothetical protein [Flavobacterium ichthyis]